MPPLRGYFTPIVPFMYIVTNDAEQGSLLTRSPSSVDRQLDATDILTPVSLAPVDDRECEFRAHFLSGILTLSYFDCYLNQQFQLYTPMWVPLDPCHASSGEISCVFLYALPIMYGLVILQYSIYRYCSWKVNNNRRVFIILLCYILTRIFTILFEQELIVYIHTHSTVPLDLNLKSILLMGLFCRVMLIWVQFMIFLYTNRRILCLFKGVDTNNRDICISTKLLVVVGGCLHALIAPWVLINMIVQVNTLGMYTALSGGHTTFDWKSWVVIFSVCIVTVATTACLLHPFLTRKPPGVKDIYDHKDIWDCRYMLIDTTRVHSEISTIVISIPVLVCMISSCVMVRRRRVSNGK